MTRDEHEMTIGAEECVEVAMACLSLAQRIQKAQRFGMHQVQQDADDQPQQNPDRLTNWERIRREFVDLVAAMDMLGITLSMVFDDEVAAKREKVERYLKRSEACGTLTAAQVTDETPRDPSEASCAVCGEPFDRHIGKPPGLSGHWFMPPHWFEPAPSSSAEAAPQKEVDPRTRLTESDAKLADRLEAIAKRLSIKSTAWRMSVPVRPDDDDMIVCEAARRLRATPEPMVSAAALRELTAKCEESSVAENENANAQYASALDQCAADLEHLLDGATEP